MQRLGEESYQIIALFGSRQTGKTTILRQVLEHIPVNEWRRLDVDNPVSFSSRPPLDATGATFPLPQREPRDYESNRLRIAYESPTDRLRIAYESPTNRLRIAYESPTDRLRLAYDSPTTRLRIVCISGANIA